MNREGKESIRHGSEGYPFALYKLRNVSRIFHVPMHWHEEMEIIYIEKGTLYVTIGTQSYIGNSGDFFIVNSSEMHGMHIDSRDTNYITMLFSLPSLLFLNMDNTNKEFLMPLVEQKQVFVHEVTDSLIHGKIEEDIRKIIELNEEQEVTYQLGTKIYLLDIVYQLYLGKMMVRIENRSKLSELSSNVLEYVREYYSEDISLGEIARRFHMSEKYFSRWFKENFHLSFVEYITHLRISKATDLLTQSDLSITEIALECGFSSSSYFNKRFKKLIGVNPKKYRE